MSSSEYFNIGRSLPMNNPGTPLAQFGKMMSQDAAEVLAANQRMQQIAQQDRSLEIQQQNADFNAPKKLYMSPNSLGTIYNPSAYLENAARVGSQMRINEAALMPQRPLYKVGPNGQVQQIDQDQIPKVPGVRTSSADGEFSGDRQLASNGAEQIKQAIADFSNGVMAKKMGLQIGPDGEVYGAGRQVIEYYKQLDNLTSLQTKLVDSNTGGYAPAAQVIPPPPRERAPQQKTQDPVILAGKWLAVNKNTDQLAALTDPTVIQKNKDAQAVASAWAGTGVRPDEMIAEFNKKYTPDFLKQAVLGGQVNSAPSPESDMQSQKLRSPKQPDEVEGKGTRRVQGGKAQYKAKSGWKDL